jgi:hypothetical protein
LIAILRTTAQIFILGLAHGFICIVLLFCTFSDFVRRNLEKPKLNLIFHVGGITSTEVGQSRKM